MLSDEDIATLTGDFQDFLYKVAMNYKVSYDDLAAIIFAQLVALSQQTGRETTILRLLPMMEQSIIDGMEDKPLH